MTHGAALLQTAASAGVEVCFANPGTTEMPLVLAFDEAPGVRPVLCLFEGVCTGAADGYGRMKDLPALTLLHLGPGVGNGIANTHNANRACSPMVNIIGDHASWHRAQLALAEKEKHPFAAAFHQGRLAGFEPWNATVRLKEAEAWAKAGQNERAARAFLQAVFLDPHIGRRPR